MLGGIESHVTKDAESADIEPEVEDVDE